MGRRVFQRGRDFNRTLNRGVKLERPPKAIVLAVNESKVLGDGGLAGSHRFNLRESAERFA